MRDRIFPKNILITGASSGLGKAIALHLGEIGVGIGVGFHSGEARANDVVDEIISEGGKAVAIGGDTSCEDDVARMFKEAKEGLGPITACVVNAGVQADASILDMDLEDWRKPIEVNLTGAFLCARTFLRQLPEPQEDAEGETPRSKGVIVFMSSVHEFVPWAYRANYAAAKGGLDMLMRSIAQEVACEGIRVNSIAPGAIATDINDEITQDEEKRDELLKFIPYDRLGDPKDVAEAAAWLLCDASDYVTGTSLVIDGGMALYPGFKGNG